MYNLTSPTSSNWNDSSDSGLLTRIRGAVYTEHPEIQAAWFSISDERLADYWIVIPERDVALVRRLLEEQQQKVIRLFANTANPPFQLDCHIVYGVGRDASSLVPSGATRILKP